VAQWVWNLRLELGHHLKPEPVRTTEFAPALGDPPAGPPPVIGGTWKAGCYAGEDFVLQPDGTVCCPAGKRLFPKARRQERDCSLRVVYEARIADCRACEKRPQCQWHGHQAQHPRRVSATEARFRQLQGCNTTGIDVGKAAPDLRPKGTREQQHGVKRPGGLST